MRYLNKFTVFLFFWMSLLLVAAGCGVKGMPSPPTNPASIGRGKPTYKESNPSLLPNKPTNKPEAGQQ